MGSNSAGLYGYIVAGDPNTSIAYIIPAHQAISDIEQRFELEVTFPTAKQLMRLPGKQDAADTMDSTSTFSDTSSDSKFSEDENADIDPYPYGLVPKVSSFPTWDQNLSGGQTWPSRPTTPSETSYDVDVMDVHTTLECNLGEHWSVEIYPREFCGNTMFVIPEVGTIDETPFSWSIDIPDISSIPAELRYESHSHLFDMQTTISAPPLVDATKSTGLNSPPRRRQRLLTSKEKEEARTVRTAKACWACHLAKIKARPLPGSVKF